MRALAQNELIGKMNTLAEFNERMRQKIDDLGIQPVNTLSASDCVMKSKIHNSRQKSATLINRKRLETET